MALVVEDGSVVAGANSYASLTTIRQYATERGITALSADDAVLEAKVILAMDWFEGQTFISSRIDAEQPLSFPREKVTIDGVTYYDAVPPLVINVLCQAVCEASTLDLETNIVATGAGTLKRKKLDVMEKEYFAPSWSDKQTYFAKLERMISPLVINYGRLKVYRG